MLFMRTQYMSCYFVLFTILLREDKLGKLFESQPKFAESVQVNEVGGKLVRS